MAVIKRGILGGFQNKIANVVGSSWKGIATMRSLPISVANPNTALQQAQRTKFGGAVKLAKELLTDTIKPNWDRFAQQMSGYNAFISRNIDVFDANGNIVSYPTLVTSEGVLTPVGGVAGGTDPATNLIEVTWISSNGIGTAQPTDRIYIVSINSRTGLVVENSTALRSALSVQFSGVDILAGDILHTYVSARSADGTRVSNSVYVALSDV